MSEIVIGTDEITASARFSNSNNFSFGLAGLTVTATASLGHTGPVALQGSGTALATGGSIQFATSPTMTFGLVGSTITASVATAGATSPNVSISQPMHWGGNVSPNFASFTRPLIFPLNQLKAMQGNMTWDSFGVVIAPVSPATTMASYGLSISFGLYRLTNSTQLTLINSASWSSGSAFSNSSFSNLWNGNRFLTLDSSEWSAQPVVSAGLSYWMGIGVSASNIPSLWFHGSAQLPLNHFSGPVGAPITNRPAYPFLGFYTANTAAMPTAVSVGEVLAATYAGGQAAMIPNIIAAQGVSWLP